MPAVFRSLVLGLFALVATSSFAQEEKTREQVLEESNAIIEADAAENGAKRARSLKRGEAINDSYNILARFYSQGEATEDLEEAMAQAEKVVCAVIDNQKKSLKAGEPITLAVYRPVAEVDQLQGTVFAYLNIVLQNYDVDGFTVSEKTPVKFKLPEGGTEDRVYVRFVFKKITKK